jgi:hypothetical protein
MNQGVICKALRDGINGRRHCQLLNYFGFPYRSCVSDMLFQLIILMQGILRKFTSFMHFLDISVICA